VADESSLTDEVQAQLLEYLRVARPCGLVLVMRDGKPQKLALRTGKSRWTIAARVIIRQLDDVERVQLLDKTGGIVDVWQPPEAADPEAEEQEKRQLEDANVPTSLKPLLALGRLMNDHADRAVDRIMKNQAQLFGTMLESVKQTNDRLATYDRSHAAILKTLYEVTKREATVEGLLNSGALKPAGAEDPNAVDPATQRVVDMLMVKLGVDPRMFQPTAAPAFTPNASPPAAAVEEAPEESPNH